jgi:hypothetical protein
MTGQSEQSWDLWGLLAERYREQRPRKILALDLKHLGPFV